jgi:hypothetical protein
VALLVVVVIIIALRGVRAGRSVHVVAAVSGAPAVTGRMQCTRQRCCAH